MMKIEIITQVGGVSLSFCLQTYTCTHFPFVVWLSAAVPSLLLCVTEMCVIKRMQVLVHQHNGE